MNFLEHIYAFQIRKFFIRYL